MAETMTLKEAVIGTNICLFFFILSITIGYFTNFESEFASIVCLFSILFGLGIQADYVSHSKDWTVVMQHVSLVIGCIITFIIYVLVEYYLECKKTQIVF